MRRVMLVNVLFGLWLMLAPFVLSWINKSVVSVLWEDLLLGFGIAAFALCRMLSRRAEEIAIADWIVTALASLTLLNPILYGYFRLSAAAWNNIVIGAAVFLLALYQDWKDADRLDGNKCGSRSET
jgi:SPW repeat